MFQLSSGGPAGGGSMSMMNMRRTPHGSLRAEPVSFYVGLAVLVSAFALSIWRRRRRECRPLFRLRQPLTPPAL
jgi:hypothetical protein